jgi:hypothetical protein
MKINLLIFISLFCALSFGRFNMSWHAYHQQCKDFVMNTANWVNCYKNIFPSYLSQLITLEQFTNAWRHFQVDCSPMFSRNVAARSSNRNTLGLLGFICTNQIWANTLQANQNIYRANDPEFILNGVDYRGPYTPEHLRTT